jgi:hypothetical protein
MIRLESTLQAFHAFIYIERGSWVVPRVSELASLKVHIRSVTLKPEGLSEGKPPRKGFISAQIQGYRKETFIRPVKPSHLQPFPISCSFTSAPLKA